jgi:hypothetical protein
MQARSTTTPRPIPTHATSAPERRPFDDTNTNAAHLRRIGARATSAHGVPPTTAETREQANGEVREEARREYKWRHARRRGGGWAGRRGGGGDSAPLVHRLPPPQPHCMNRAACILHAALFSLFPPLLSPLIIITYYITCIIRNQYNSFFIPICNFKKSCKVYKKTSGEVHLESRWTSSGIQVEFTWTPGIFSINMQVKV